MITRTAEAAEYFSANLFQLDIPNNLLIAQNVSKEAQMISKQAIEQQSLWLQVWQDVVQILN